MIVYLINSSSKPKRSTSGYLLDQLESRISKSYDIKMRNCDDLLNDLPCRAAAIVFAFPLYMDSIPSNFLNVLEYIEGKIADANPLVKIYAIVNNAFYESHHNRYAIEILEHWCEKANVDYSGSMCVGAGPIASISPPGAKYMKSLGKGLKTFAEAINNNSVLSEDIYVEPDYSRLLYLSDANKNWIKAAQKRGLEEEDLFNRL